MDTEDGVEEGRPQVGDRDPAAVPLGVLDTNNSGEFRGDAQSNGFGKRDLCSTIARPYKPNDNARVERKSGDRVRRQAFHYRYDTESKVGLLNGLHQRVWVRANEGAKKLRFYCTSTLT